MESAQVVDLRFPLSFYFRIADQIAKQAETHREEGNNWDRVAVLARYVRLTTKIIPQHKNYPSCSSKDKIKCIDISQQFAAQLEKLKLLRAISEKDSDELINELIRNEAVTKNIETTSSFKSALGETGVILESCEFNTQAVKQYFPSRILSCVERVPLVGSVSQVVASDYDSKSSCNGPSSSSSNSSPDVHISAKLMDEFMELARPNTEKDLETCGILGASLKNQTFYTTTLIIPKQESTSSSCHALNEEEMYAIQEEMSLFPVGWIHTHPSQTCFMSSVDLHTHYPYQVMLPEAVAIVMAPTDTTRKYGIFRLTDPGGISVLRDCEEESGFHTHAEPADGSPLYEDCSNVYMNPNLRFEIIDLRFSSQT